MLNLVGKAKVTNLKEVGKMLVGTLVTFQKVDDENFIPTFLSAKFVGKAKDTIMSEGIMDKDNVDIHSAIIGTRIWNKDGQTQRDIQVTVFELVRYEDLSQEETREVAKSKFKK